MHWYERRFAVDALERAEPTASGEPLRMQPLDGLIALMLFYARDGFSGLRFPPMSRRGGTFRCGDSPGRWPADVVTERYPALIAPVCVASGLLSALVGLPIRAGESPFRWRVAEGLASPFLDGGGRQAEANAGLTDLLLAPPRSAGDAMRRVLHNAPSDPFGPAGTMTEARRASAGHLLRVARRWALAFAPAVVRSYAPWRPAR